MPDQLTTTERKPSPLQIGRDRDELITDLQGPFWATLLVEMGLFPNYEKAAKRIRKLLKKRELYFLGKCQVRPNERDSFIYGNARVPDTTLATHEVPLSLMLARWYPFATSILRLYDVDQTLRPDATMILGGKTIHFEYATGTQGLPAIRGTVAKYEDVEDITLIFVARKERRLTKILPHCKPLAGKIFFATLADVVNMKTPWGKVFWSYEGKCVGFTPPSPQPGQELGS